MKINKILLLIMLLISPLAQAAEVGATEWHLEELLKGDKPNSFIVFEDFNTKALVQFIRDPDGTIRGDLPPGAIKGHEKEASVFLRSLGIKKMTRIKTGDGKDFETYVIPFGVDTKSAAEFVYDVFNKIYGLTSIKLVAYDS